MLQINSFVQGVGISAALGMGITQFSNKYWIFCILIQILLKVVPMGPIHKKMALVLQFA